MANFERTVVRSGGSLVAFDLAAVARGRGISGLPNRNQARERAMDRGAGGSALCLSSDPRGIGGLRHRFDGSPGDGVRSAFLPRVLPVPRGGRVPLLFHRFHPRGAMAMLSKETAVMFPWALVAYEALREIPSEPAPGAEKRWKRFAWTLPYFAVVGAYLAVRTLLFGLNTGPGPGGDRFAALLDMPLVLVVYFRNLFWPFRLSFYYPGEWGAQWTLWKGAAAALVVVAAGFLWKRYRHRSGMRLQVLWVGILFTPALLGVYTFAREDWIHDRHMYLVSVPVCLLAAALLTDPKWPVKASVLASSLVLAILLIDLAVQVPRFRDDNTIFASALEVAPRSLLAHAHYALALWGYGHTEEGLRELRITTELGASIPGCPQMVWDGACKDRPRR